MIKKDIPIPPLLRRQSSEPLAPPLLRRQSSERKYPNPIVPLEPLKLFPNLTVPTAIPSPKSRTPKTPKVATPKIATPKAATPKDSKLRRELEDMMTAEAETKAATKKTKLLQDKAQKTLASIGKRAKAQKDLASIAQKAKQVGFVVDDIISGVQKKGALNKVVNLSKKLAEEALTVTVPKKRVKPVLAPLKLPETLTRPVVKSPRTPKPLTPLEFPGYKVSTPKPTVPTPKEIQTPDLERVVTLSKRMEEVSQKIADVDKKLSKKSIDTQTRPSNIAALQKVATLSNQIAEQALSIKVPRGKKTIETQTESEQRGQKRKVEEVSKAKKAKPKAKPKTETKTIETQTDIDNRILLKGVTIAGDKLETLETQRQLAEELKKRMETKRVISSIQEEKQKVIEDTQKKLVTGEITEEEKQKIIEKATKKAEKEARDAAKSLADYNAKEKIKAKERAEKAKLEVKKVKAQAFAEIANDEAEFKNELKSGNRKVKQLEAVRDATIIALEKRIDGIKNIYKRRSVPLLEKEKNELERINLEEEDKLSRAVEKKTKRIMQGYNPTPEEEPFSEKVKAIRDETANSLKAIADRVKNRTKYEENIKQREFERQIRKKTYKRKRPLLKSEVRESTETDIFKKFDEDVEKERYNEGIKNLKKVVKEKVKAQRNAYMEAVRDYRDDAFADLRKIVSKASKVPKKIVESDFKLLPPKRKVIDTKVSNKTRYTNDPAWDEIDKQEEEYQKKLKLLGKEQGVIYDEINLGTQTEEQKRKTKEAAQILSKGKEKIISDSQREVDAKAKIIFDSQLKNEMEASIKRQVAAAKVAEALKDSQQKAEERADEIKKLKLNKRLDKRFEVKLALERAEKELEEERIADRAIIKKALADLEVTQAKRDATQLFLIDLAKKSKPLSKEDLLKALETEELRSESIPRTRSSSESRKSADQVRAKSQEDLFQKIPEKPKRPTLKKTPKPLETISEPVPKPEPVPEPIPEPVPEPKPKFEKPVVKKPEKAKVFETSVKKTAKPPPTQEDIQAAKEKKALEVNLKRFQEEKAALEELKQISINTEKLERENKVRVEKETKAQELRRKNAGKKITSFLGDVKKRIADKQKEVDRLKAEAIAAEEVRTRIKAMKDEAEAKDKERALKAEERAKVREAEKQARILQAEERAKARAAEKEARDKERAAEKEAREKERALKAEAKAAEAKAAEAKAQAEAKEEALSKAIEKAKIESARTDAKKAIKAKSGVSAEAAAKSMAAADKKALEKIKALEIERDKTRKELVELGKRAKTELRIKQAEAKAKDKASKKISTFISEVGKVKTLQKEAKAKAEAEAKAKIARDEQIRKAKIEIEKSKLEFEAKIQSRKIKSESTSSAEAAAKSMAAADKKALEKIKAEADVKNAEAKYKARIAEAEKAKLEFEAKAKAKAAKVKADKEQAQAKEKREIAELEENLRKETERLKAEAKERTRKNKMAQAQANAEKEKAQRLKDEAKAKAELDKAGAKAKYDARIAQAEAKAAQAEEDKRVRDAKIRMAKAEEKLQEEREIERLRVEKDRAEKQLAQASSNLKIEESKTISQLKVFSNLKRAEDEAAQRAEDKARLEAARRVFEKTESDAKKRQAAYDKAMSKAILRAKAEAEQDSKISDKDRAELKRIEDETVKRLQDEAVKSFEKQKEDILRKQKAAEAAAEAALKAEMDDILEEETERMKTEQKEIEEFKKVQEEAVKAFRKQREAEAAQRALIEKQAEDYKKIRQAEAAEKQVEDLKKIQEEEIERIKKKRGVKEARPETKIPETKIPETKIPETKIPETKRPAPPKRPASLGTTPKQIASVLAFRKAAEEAALSKPRTEGKSREPERVQIKALAQRGRQTEKTVKPRGKSLDPVKPKLFGFIGRSMDKTPEQELKDVIDTISALPRGVKQYRENPEGPTLIEDFNEKWQSGEFKSAVDVANKGIQLSQLKEPKN
jgi:hypothetical protein